MGAVQRVETGVLSSLESPSSDRRGATTRNASISTAKVSISRSFDLRTSYTSFIRQPLRKIDDPKKISSLNRYPQWPGTRAALDKFIRTLALEQFVVFYRDRNAMLHILNFVRLHDAAELLNKGTAPESELVAILQQSL